MSWDFICHTNAKHSSIFNYIIQLERMCLIPTKNQHELQHVQAIPYQLRGQDIEKYEGASL